jgi:hypothetical protein
VLAADIDVECGSQEYTTRDDDDDDDASMVRSFVVRTPVVSCVGRNAVRGSTHGTACLSVRSLSFPKTTE